MNEPVFPVNDFIHPNGQVEHGFTGMTLRDCFAGQALIGFCAFGGGTSHIDPRRHDDGVANECYRIADAMLEARKR